MEKTFEKIEGIIVAPFTPFNKQGEVNPDPIGEYARMLKRNRLSGVFINGSSGEGYLLTSNERMMLTEAWMGVDVEDFKVIVHVGSCSVRESMELAAHAQAMGAWGIGAMAPPFPKIGRVEELARYCEEIAAAAPDLPFYFYHIPAFNGAYLPMVDLLRAVDKRVKNFAGIKYTYESMYEYNQCRLFRKGRFDMLHGQDETLLPQLAMGGATGSVSGTANYNGHCLMGIVDAWKNGDIDKARHLQNYAQKVINIVSRYGGNIVAGKRIMRLMGMDLGENRTPLRNLTDKEEKKMASTLRAIDFFNKCNTP